MKCYSQSGFLFFMDSYTTYTLVCVVTTSLIPKQFNPDDLQTLTM